MRVAKQAIGLNIVRAVLKSKRRTEERMMPGNCREEEKKRKKEKMKKRRKEEGCFENSFASSTMRGPPMTYVNDEKKSLYWPQGSGRLRQQLLMVHCIAWYCMVNAWYCMVLHVIALNCRVLHLLIYWKKSKKPSHRFINFQILCSNTYQSRF